MHSLLQCDPLQVQAEIRKERGRRSLSDFTLYTDPNYHMNWHHRLLCQFLDEFVLGTSKRAMVFMPPRHGKSELVSRKLPAYLLGRFPHCEIIAASYSADLSQRFNRDVQRIIDSPAYQTLFPATMLSGKGSRSHGLGNYSRTADIFEIVQQGGAYRCAGVGGGITGMGGDFILLDDPIKNKEEAQSSVFREKLWDWYTSTLYTRLEGEGRLLLTLTRWHEDDLAGRLLRLAKENPLADQWDVLSLPALSETDNRHPLDTRAEGEALWEEKFSAVNLARTRATIGSYDWAAMYQQMPQPAQGTIFQREWFSRRFQILPAGATLIQTWDLPFKKSEASAKCAGLVLAKKGAELFVVDCINEKMDFTTSVAAIRNMTSKHPTAIGKVIEDKANGPAIINFLQRDIAGMIPFSPRGSKVDRALSVAPYFEAGNVLFPEGKAWVGDLIEDLVGFPNGTYKDTVDALVQGILYFMQRPPSYSLGEGAVLEKNTDWNLDTR